MNMLQRSIVLLCTATAFGTHAEPRAAWPDAGSGLTGATLVEALKKGAIGAALSALGISVGRAREPLLPHDGRRAPHRRPRARCA
jgi:hypothetical protein